MTHSHHTMDANSLAAYARCRPEALTARLYDILSAGIPRTAKELTKMTNADLVSVRARLSDGCNPPPTEAPKFRKAIRVKEEGSKTRVWCFALAGVMEAMP